MRQFSVDALPHLTSKAAAGHLRTDFTAATDVWLHLLPARATVISIWQSRLAATGIPCRYGCAVQKHGKHLEHLCASGRRLADQPRSVWVLTLFAGIGGFLFGYDTGVISGALPYLRDALLLPAIHDDRR